MEYCNCYIQSWSIWTPGVFNYKWPCTLSFTITNRSFIKKTIFKSKGKKLFLPLNFFKISFNDILSYLSAFLLTSIFIVSVSFKKDSLFYEKELSYLIETRQIRTELSSGFFIPPKVIPFSQNRFSHTEFELVPFQLIKKKAGDLDYDIPKTGNSCWIATLPCANIIIKKKLQLKTPKVGPLEGIFKQ